MEARLVLDASTRAAERNDYDEEAAAALLLMLLTRGWGRAIADARLRAAVTVAEDVRIAEDLPAGPLPGARIDYAAARYASRWRRASAQARADGASRRLAKRSATKALKGYGGMVAVTEASVAYNSAREAAAFDFAVRSRETVHLEWSAELDRRTCPTCESRDGERTLAIVGWGGDGPGAVHPRCRCTSRIIVEGRRRFAA